MDACPAGLADAVVSGKLAGKGLLEGYGTGRTDLGTPAAVHAPVQVDDCLSFHPQAAVFCQVPVLNLNAGLRADINTQAAVHASIVYSRRLKSNAEVGLVHLRLACRPDLQGTGRADAGA